MFGTQEDVPNSQKCTEMNACWAGAVGQKLCEIKIKAGK